MEQKSAHSALILTITQLHSVLYYFYFHTGWCNSNSLTSTVSSTIGDNFYFHTAGWCNSNLLIWTILVRENCAFYHLDPWLRFKRKTTQQKVFSLPSRAEAAFSFPTLCFLHSHFLRCLFPPPSLLEQFHYYLDNIFYRKLQQQKGDWLHPLHSFCLWVNCKHSN